MTRSTKTEKNIKHPYIEKKKGICGGEPVIKGTRLSVRLIIGWYEMEMSVDEIVAMYPHIHHSEVFDALSYFYDHRQEIERIRQEKSEDAVRKKYEGVKWVR